MELQDILTEENIRNGVALTAFIANKKLFEDLMLKLLGPTVSYLGDGLKNSLEKKYENICNIFMVAFKKSMNKDCKNSQVNPRILKSIIEDGSFIENDIAVEYFSGVLASSKTQDFQDDRGLLFLDMIKNMSSYEMLIHNFIYKTIKNEFSEDLLYISASENRRKMKIFIPYSDYIDKLKKTIHNEDIENIILDAFIKLDYRGLISDDWVIGDNKKMKICTNGKTVLKGLYLIPTSLGCNLMMWVYGYGQTPLNRFFDDNVNFDDNLNIYGFDNVLRLS